MTRNIAHSGLVPLLAVLIAACGGGGSSGAVAPPVPSPPTQTNLCPARGELCATELLAGDAARIVDNRFFIPTAGAALHALTGTLNVSPTALSSSPADAGGRTLLPGFSVPFITVDNRLLPLEREIIAGGGGNRWSVILSPGKVWSETGDQGMSRASFPFTLVTDKWNEAHNGVATFLFDDTSVSALRLQVSQETATWNKIDVWAAAPMTYDPQVIAGADRIVDDFREELGARVETRPWSELVAQVGDNALGPFARNISDGQISASAILVDNTLYHRPSFTRAGDYPYPLEMRHGVFSVTKSSAAALTLLRLAEKYGEQVFDLFVSDYLNVTADHGGWNGITFGHLLSMVAGVGDNSPNQAVGATFADENDDNSAIWTDLWNARTREQKLAQAFRYGDYPWGPGIVVRYNTAHTFILGAAMDSLYKTMAGPDADVWQMMKDEVYAPIGIAAMPTIKTDGADALPIYGFGLFLNAYDTARIMQLLHNDGAWNGVQLLHRDRTRHSLHKDGGHGYTTASTTPTTTGASQQIHYLNSFWSISLSDASCAARIPYMWGFGGNFVVVLPNGVGAYRYADADVHDPAALALAALEVRPLCPQ